MSTSAHYIAHGYAAQQGQGPLSIVYLTAEHLVLAGTVTPQPALVARLERGEPIEEVLGELSSFNRVETPVPLAGLRELIWREGQNGVQIVYEDEQHRLRRHTTYLSTPESRRYLIHALQQHYGRPLEERQEPAGVLSVIWSQLLGAVFSIMGGAAIVLLWDPIRLARIRGGGLALWLGLEGCVVVAVLFFLGCLYDAWRRLHPPPQNHRWIV